jgi:hypothetical protein
MRPSAPGNGARRDGVVPVNATCELDWTDFLAHLLEPDRRPPPVRTSVVRYDLGTMDGVPLGFTDAALWRGGTLYTAAAEDSPDAVRDGRVAGTVVGVVDADDPPAGSLLCTVRLSGDW